MSESQHGALNLIPLSPTLISSMLKPPIVRGTRKAITSLLPEDLASEV